MMTPLDNGLMKGERTVVLPRKLAGMFYHTKMFEREFWPAYNNYNATLTSVRQGGATTLELVHAEEDLRVVTDRMQRLVDAAHPGNNGMVKAAHYIVVYHLVHGNKVQSIKTLRAVSKFGLKESKDIVDSLQHKMYTRGLAPDSPSFAVNHNLSQPEHRHELACLELAAGV